MNESRPFDASLVGKRLQAIRAHFELSQSKFGRLTGTTVTRISNWENGRQRPSMEAAKEIVDAFDLTLDWLMLGRCDERLSLYRHLATAEAKISAG